MVIVLLLLATPVFAELSPASRAIPLLEKYCRACHGFGERRFLYNESAVENWDRLVSTKTKSGELWIEAIYRSLNWNSPIPPEPNEKMPSGKSWMPKGSKRYDIAEDEMERRSARETLLNELRWVVE